MASAFVQATAVGVRRQAKTSDDSVSLRRFLTEVQKYPSLVSREYYISLYAGKGPLHVELGQHDFHRVAGEHNPHVPTEFVEDRIRELMEAVGTIEHYVDRRVAHYDKRRLAEPTPTFADLSAALRTLERIVILYWRLLKGASMTTLLPTIQFDWQDVFRFAWMAAQRTNTHEVM